ncbi:MAG: phage portal protein [Prevotellaceae bacterium]|nr:phage portal protein [Prevotellaceae bacterium]
MALFGKFRRQRRELPTPALTGKGASYQQRIARASTEETALCVAAIYRAADIRSNSIGSLKLRLLMWNKAGKFLEESHYGGFGRENHVLQVRPNSRQNAFQFWKQVEMMRMFDGHCYILPSFKDGFLSELIPCRGIWNSLTDTYTLENMAFGLSGVQVRGEDILVLRGITTRLHPEGESIIHYAARTASVSATIESLSLESAAKGGRQKLIMQQKADGGLTGIGGLDPMQMQEQARRLEESIYSNDVVYDDSISTITPISMNAVDLQLLDTRKFTVADIARFFGVPRSLLMDDSNSSYKTPEAATTEFMSRTIMPIIKETEAEFDAKLLSPEDYGHYAYRYDTKALYELDRETSGNYNKTRLETGMASINEMRAEMNLPAVDNGDDHFVSCNVAPVGSEKLSGSTTTNNQGNESTDAEGDKAE